MYVDVRVNIARCIYAFCNEWISVGSSTELILVLSMEVNVRVLTNSYTHLRIVGIFDVPFTLLRCCLSHSAGSSVIFGACLRSVPPKACLCYTPQSDSSNYLPGSGASKSGHFGQIFSMCRGTQL